MPANRGLSRPLAALLRWWLQRQVTQAQELDVILNGASQVWWSGCLPYIQVSAQNIIYRDMHLAQVALTAQNIRFHLPFLHKKGEPFLEPITVQIHAVITEQNLNHSLPYLQEILCSYLRELSPEITQIQQCFIHPESITWLINQGEEYPTQINLISPQELILISATQPGKWVRLDLGTDVQIQAVNLRPGSIHLAGDLIIRPEAPAG